MKKVFQIFIALVVFPIVVQAAGSYSLSVPSSVEVGSTVTASITVKNVAAWNIHIASSGNTSGCSTTFADASTNGKNTTKTFSVKCKATSIGAMAFTISGDITSADGQNTNVSTSKRVTITQVREKATDPNLASITIEGYELTPAFSKDTLEYEITVPSTVNKIKIDAKANESHASVSGTGELEVTEGLNTFEIICTAENGTTKTYIVKVNVEDTNPIEVKVGNDTYTVIKNAKNLIKPETYEEKTVLINDFTIPAFYSDITKFTLVGLKSADGKISLAIYDESKNTYTLYNEMNQNTLTLYLTDFDKELKGYKKGTLVINDITVPVYRYSDSSRFVLVYGLNVETGKYDYYRYDTKEGTFQIWDTEELDVLKKDVQTYMVLSIGLGGILFLSIILILHLLNKKETPKKDKKQEKKQSKEKKSLDKKIEEFDQF